MLKITTNAPNPIEVNNTNMISLVVSRIIERAHAIKIKISIKKIIDRN